VLSFDGMDDFGKDEGTDEAPVVRRTGANTASRARALHVVVSRGAVGRSVYTRPARQANATAAKTRGSDFVRICSGTRRTLRLRTVGRAPVLLVDDDSSLVEAVKLGLESHGYPVVTAHDGNEGLERLRTEHPCVVLLDLDMPGTDGWQFLERQQADPCIASVPVVVVSGRSDTNRKARALRAAERLQKPVDLDAVVATVRRQCATV
jgi:CheY-like chemotaxis protein